MHQVIVLGAGRIGRLVACLLKDSGAYDVILTDVNAEHLEADLFGKLNDSIDLIQLDAANKDELRAAIQKYHATAVISCLPFFCNPLVAEVASEVGIAYFDLTEDIEVAKQVEKFSQNSKNPFVPQCGLAPGFISVVANDLMQGFHKLDAVFLRVGALPVYPNNALKYGLTWSTDGLINEYGNTCYGILHGKEVVLQPLEGLETLQIDGLLYEAFNTSGGLGSLAKTYLGKVNMLNYKSLRYPGHCKAMRLLMNDLKLNEDRTTLKRILEHAIPATSEDVVIVYVAVRGYVYDELIEKTYVKKIYPREIAGKRWTAIQVTTASSVCAIVDEVLSKPDQYQGYIKQEIFSLKAFLANRFGNVYA